MKVFKVIADSKPEWCEDCPLHPKCNKSVLKGAQGKHGRNSDSSIPGELCPIITVDDFKPSQVTEVLDKIVAAGRLKDFWNAVMQKKQGGIANVGHQECDK